MNDTLGNGTVSHPNVSAEDGPLATAVFSINLILGLPINSYALWLILSGAGGTLTIASELFYLNLIVSVATSYLATVFYFARLHAAVLAIALVLYFLSVPSFQCCICLERYMAVVHPVVFLRYKALRYRVACSCVVWLTVLAFSSSAVWLYKGEEVVPYILVGLDMVYISVVSFCCVSVLRALKQPGPGEGQKEGGEGNSMKTRAFRIILISLIVMVLTTMIHILHLLNSLFLPTHTTVLYITYALAMMSGFVHPLLYIHKVGKLPCFKAL